MFFKCNNCGGNVIYSPEKRKMVCPFCDSEDSESKVTSAGKDMTICPNCGGQVQVLEHTAATQCPYCDSYLILDERVEGEYEPKMIIPFQMGKETCKTAIRDKFKKCRFAPIDFLSEVRLNSMQGVYVPYWFYDYDVNYTFQGEGTRVRSWTTGNMQYTETSYYDVYRDMDMKFRKIPVDASIGMPDDIMDLMEPFGYNQLEDFKPEYLSGFYAEKYNMKSDLVESRAKEKMKEGVDKTAAESYAGYNSVRTINQNSNITDEKINYGLLPIWKYIYRYKDTDYPFYVNGQTGKIVGIAPLSKAKVWFYAGTLWAVLTLSLTFLSLFLKFI